LPAEQLAFWDEQTQGFVVELGDYQIMAGASSADIRDEKLVTVAR
jgi:hypothetical protein